MNELVVLVALTPIKTLAGIVQVDEPLELPEADAAELVELGAARPAAPAEVDAAVVDEQLVAAIAAMLGADPTQAREDWWTNDGAPDSRVLSERLGRRVSAAERDATWAAHMAAAE